MSFLLNTDTRVPEALTVWSYSSFDAYGQPVHTAPSLIYGIWEDIDVLAISGSGKDQTVDTFVFSEHELEVGAFILQGRSVADKPPPEAKEVRLRRTMKFITDRQITYKYSL